MPPIAKSNLHILSTLKLTSPDNYDYTILK